MKVAVIGCGAIGGLFLGYLSKENRDVVGVLKDYQREAISREGLIIEGVRGRHQAEVCVTTKISEPPDLVIFSTKINDLEGVVAKNYEFIKGAVALTTQNGVRADYIVKNYFPPERIITGIVMFGATYYPPNRVIHNFEGELIIGSLFDKEIESLSRIQEVLGKAFKVSFMDNIKGAKYLKVFINLNNCLPAVLGTSMQEAFSDLEISQLAISLNKEAYEVITKSKIEVGSLPSYPKQRLEGLIAMKTEEAAKLFSHIMTSLSKEPLYGSILQSIKRGKKSEVDFINGEIARLAQENYLEAPLNERITKLVHEVENTGRFFSKEEALSWMRS